MNKIEVAVGTPPVQRRTVGPIVNLTQHTATPEQIAAGVVDLDEPQRKELQKLLTFDLLPTANRIYTVAYKIAMMANRSHKIAMMANRCMPEGRKAMIGGAPFLMSALEFALSTYEIDPLYSFSKRESVQKTMPDGSVEKVAVFQHIGFVEGL